MIIFEKIRWKNFLSSGNSFIEVDLNNNSTTLVVGHNGAGKSTILDALCFALFGKPFREIKKEQLVNSINLGGTEVELEFSISSNRYRIKRGIKPSIFEVYQNDELINQTSTVADDIAERSEDTPTLLDNYVNELETDLNKDKLKTLMRTLYTEAGDMEI